MLGFRSLVENMNSDADEMQIWYNDGSSYSSANHNPFRTTVQKNVTVKTTKKRSRSGTVKMHDCTICGASFDSSNLASHNRIHSGERPYKCDICGVSFAQSSNLKSHKRTHTGERPYSCSECKQTFTRSCHLTDHKRIHSGERPYVCGYDNCYKGFASNSHLRQHVRMHTKERPYACRMCDASFSHRTTLQSHFEQQHTEERPFKCDICKSSFKSKKYLRSHDRVVHASECTIYTCSQCEKSFKTKWIADRHVTRCKNCTMIISTLKINNIKNEDDCESS